MLGPAGQLRLLVLQGPDKDELLAEVVRHSFAEWLSGQPDWAPMPPGAPLADGLRAVLDPSVRTLTEAPDFLRIGQMLTLENRATEPAARTLYVRIRAEVEERVTAWFDAGLDDEVRSRRPELARTLARFVIASTDGYFLAHQIDEPWDPAELVYLLVGTVEAAVAEAAGDEEERA